MKILYGTTNRAKLELMKPVADALGFEVIGLNDLNGALPNIDESGKDPLENAEIKARAYYAAYGLPVFSCDSGLYFDGLPEDLQPMTHIRRIKGKVLTDEEMTAYYAGLSEAHGGKLIGRYKNAVYFIVNAELCFSRMDDSLASEPFIVSSIPHEKSQAGFPIDRLSIEIKTGKYYYDIENKVDKLAVVDGLMKFFKDALAKIRRYNSAR